MDSLFRRESSLCFTGADQRAKCHYYLPSQHHSVHSVLYVFQQGSFYYSGLDNWTMSSHEYRDTSRAGWDPGVKGFTVLFWFWLENWPLDFKSDMIKCRISSHSNCVFRRINSRKKYLRPAIALNSRVRMLFSMQTGQTGLAQQCWKFPKKCSHI